MFVELGFGSFGRDFATVSPTASSDGVGFFAASSKVPGMINSNSGSLYICMRTKQYTECRVMKPLAFRAKTFQL